MSGRLDALCRWLGIVSNLGVTAGFVLLAVQIRQSADEIRLQHVTTRMDSARAVSVAMLGENPSAAFSAAMLHPADVTAEQVNQLWALLEVYVIAAHETWQAYRAGYATADDWQAAKQVAVLNINHPVARTIWMRMKASYSPDVVSEIDRALAQQPDLDWPGAYRGILEDLRAFPIPAASASSEQP